jgi:hypothetical protein
LEDCVLGQSQQAAAADPPALLLTQAAKLATRGIGKGGGSTKRKKQVSLAVMCTPPCYFYRTGWRSERLLDMSFQVHAPTPRAVQGKELWLCSQGSYSWQTKTSTSRLDLNRLFLLHEDWGREAIVLVRECCFRAFPVANGCEASCFMLVCLQNSFTQQLLDRLAPHTAGLRHVYLYLPLLECGRFLSVPLAEQWAAERLLQPDMRVLLIATKPFALIVHVRSICIASLLAVCMDAASAVRECVDLGATLSPPCRLKR